MDRKILLSSKITLAILAVFLGFLCNIKYKQWASQKAIEKEKTSLALQADQLDKKNQELDQSLSYLNSQSFKERVARQQLNLKKDGETVYNFSNPQVSPGDDGANQKSGKSNIQKWWEYFYDNK